MAEAPALEAFSRRRPRRRCGVDVAARLPRRAAGGGRFGGRPRRRRQRGAVADEPNRAARQALRECPVDQLPHIAAWRDAYRAFGAKPQRTRNSVEALTRRAEGGLPRVNRLTDIYNAVSVLHQLPVGGEDLARYRGAPQLIRATGAGAFDTTPTVLRSSSTPTRARWCGVTTPG